MPHLPDENFEVEFYSAGERAEEGASLFGYTPEELCKIKFKIKRGWQDYIVATFVDRARFSAEDYVKVAMHQLHLDFQRLADQTKEWKLPEDEILSVPANPPKRDIPF